jgi:broad specificity phosphatase PhoE
MGQLLLVRHGQASFGADDYDCLSPLGLEQARLLGEWFANRRQRFSLVVSGSLRRQRQTAEACLAALPKGQRTDTDWSTDPGFNEYDHQEVLVRYRPQFASAQAVQDFLANSAKPRLAFQQEFAHAMTRWMSGEHDAQYSESWPQFRARCVAALQRLCDSPLRGQSVIVFTSGGVIAALAQHLMGMGDRETARLSWSLVNCGVTRLLYQPGQISLSTLNCHAHLDWLGEPDMITYR